MTSLKPRRKASHGWRSWEFRRKFDTSKRYLMMEVSANQARSEGHSEALGGNQLRDKMQSATYSVQLDLLTLIEAP